MFHVETNIGRAPFGVKAFEAGDNIKTNAFLA
jgi:hypothetical protein